MRNSGMRGIAAVLSAVCGPMAVTGPAEAAVPSPQRHVVLSSPALPAAPSPRLDRRASADLRLSAKAPRRSRVGRQLRWVVRVSNRGPATARNTVLVAASISRGMSEVRVRASRPTAHCHAVNIWAGCFVGSLARGAGVTVTFTGVPTRRSRGYVGGSFYTDAYTNDNGQMRRAMRDRRWYDNRRHAGTIVLR